VASSTWRCSTAAANGDFEDFFCRKLGSTPDDVLEKRELLLLPPAPLLGCLRLLLLLLDMVRAKSFCMSAFPSLVLVDDVFLLLPPLLPLDVVEVAAHCKMFLIKDFLF
jgi:hypothetical protein